MEKYILPEGEAHLLVAVFEHLRKYSERAKENDTSVSVELSECTEDISVYASAINHAIANCLNDREREVIKRRYILSPYTECSPRAEIARDFDTTCERIRQCEARAVHKIRRFMTELNTEEILEVVLALGTQAQRELQNSKHAQEQGDSVADEVYMHHWKACIDAANKIKIQHEIRRWQDGHEQS